MYLCLHMYTGCQAYIQIHNVSTLVQLCNGLIVVARRYQTPYLTELPCVCVCVCVYGGGGVWALT